MKAPAGDPGDFCIAQRAESTLFIPEKAKSAGTPKRFQHVSPFPFFEVGFIGWIVRVGFAFDLNVSFDGSATWRSTARLYLAALRHRRFPRRRTSHDPRAAPKVFRFEPASGFCSGAFVVPIATDYEKME